MSLKVLIALLIRHPNQNNDRENFVATFVGTRLQYSRDGGNHIWDKLARLENVLDVVRTGAATWRSVYR